MIDLRQSPQFGKYLQAIGWQVENLDGCQVFIRRLPLIGSIIKIQRPNTIPFEKIDDLAQKFRALFVKLEPKQKLVDRGFHQDSWPLLPTKTIWLDLTKTENQLWQEMTKDTRYCLKKAQASNLTVATTLTIEQFYKNFKKFGKGYIPKKKELQSLLDSFGKRALLLLAKGLAGALILVYDRAAYYYYAFTSPLGRKVFAQYLIVWEGIKRAKKLDCRIFDFEGIEDPRFRVTHRWRGFSHFKKSFGGRKVEFPGSFTKIYHPILRLLPRIA